MYSRFILVLVACWQAAASDVSDNSFNSKGGPVSKIDVHHHAIPPKFREAWDASGLNNTDGVRLPPWTPQSSLSFMDQYNISTAVLSLPAPATNIVGTNGAAFYRDMNQYMSNLTKTYPKRFGFYAGVPSPEDPDTCIAEIRYAIQELGADGVNLMTSYSGLYLGAPVFKPVWDELNRLNAIVALHPPYHIPFAPITNPTLVNSGLDDWVHETTRTAAHLIITDTIRTHPNVRIILPHGGGHLPYTINRIAQFAQFASTSKTPDQVKEEAKSFYYDLAFTGFVEPMNLLLDFTKSGHLFYGTDFPFVPNNTMATEETQISSVLSGRRDASAVYKDGAARLFGKWN